MSPRPRQILFQIAVVLVLVAVLAGGGIAVARANLNRTASKPIPTVLHWANEGGSDLFTLDPAVGPDFNARQAAQLIFGGLVRFGPKFKILPDIAVRWDVSGDGRSYTFHLRQHVLFADGTPVTAKDVVFSLTRTLSPPNARHSGAILLSDIEGAPDLMAGRTRSARGITIVDPLTVRIRLHAASGSFLAKLANPGGWIVPTARVLADPKHWDQHAFGTGPFMVARWIHNDALLLRPNPHYYGGSLRVGGIEIPFIPEPVAAYKRYRAGGVDIMGTIHFPTEMLYDVQQHADFHSSPRLETVYLTLNTRTRPLADARVRLAFARAIDKRQVVRDVYRGFAHATNGMLPPGLPGYDPKLHGASYDPQFARTLLSRAGYPSGKGLPTVTFPVDQSAESVILVTALANQWRQTLGVNVRLRQYSHADYLQLLQRNDFQIAVIDWTADYPDPENFLSQLLQSTSPNNNGGWNNATFDRLTNIADGMKLSDEHRFVLYHRAEEIAMGNGAAIPLVNPNAGILRRTTIRGLQIQGGLVLVKDWTKVHVIGGS